MSKAGTAGAIIVAAGKSERMDGVDKVMVALNGKPVLAWVIDAFERCKAIERIAVVVSNRNLAQVRGLIFKEGWTKNIKLCTGGRRRQDSVRVGLERLDGCDWVVIHDGARPLVTVDLINRGLKAARENDTAVAAVQVTDTIKVVSTVRIVQYTPGRENLWVVQTPQIFRFDIIAEAYRKVKGDVTDDATLVERSGYSVQLYNGSYDNIKITTPVDLALAEVLLKKRRK